MKHPATPPPRLHYLDNLRTLGILGLIPYHTARIFDWPVYYMKAGSYSGFELGTRFIDAWFMPVFFVIAGAAAHYSLKRRSKTSFLKERATRLLVPFLAGLALLMPVNGYFAYQRRTGEAVGFIEYLRKFLEIHSLEGFEGQFSIGHLWFLIYLMGYALLTPWLLRLRVRVFQGPAALGAREGVLRLLGAILILFGLAFSSRLPYPNPFYFLAYYVAGLVLFGVPDMASGLFAAGRLYLGIGLCTMTTFLYLRLTMGPSISGTFWFESLGAFNAVVWVLGVMHLGRAYLAGRNGFLQWMNVYGIWVYVIHVPAISVVGYLLLPVIADPVLAWVSIVTLACALTLPSAMLARRLESR